MPSWFTKLFKPGEEVTTAPQAKPAPNPALRPSILFNEPEEEPRRVVQPTILADVEDVPGPSDGIRIKAKVEADGATCVFMVDRPVLEGASAWFGAAEDSDDSILARSIFECEGVDTVLIHGMNVTVTRDPLVRTPWEDWAKEIGARIRGHIESGKPTVEPEFLQQIPPEEDIESRLQKVLDTVINPGIAAHSGAIELDHVEGNTVYIRMLGGCQGCAASTITLRQGVHEAFRDAVPALGAILDQTDHAAGMNPFYRQLPQEM
ncbi:MAG: NifU family protein [FCB group bacterium]|nr:NifU family protein [FCB group bacterium]